MKAILILTLFILPASLFSQVWQQTAGTPEGSGVTEMVVRQSNQHIFVTTSSFNWPNGDMGGVRRSTDDGATWQNLNEVFIARTIIDAQDGNLFASIWPFPSPEGLYRSTDNGDNWGSPLVTVTTGDNIFSIAVNTLTNPNTIFAGTRNGPLRSTDNGVNWAPAINGIPPNSWVRDIEVDTGGYVAAATTNGMFISTNNGDLWEQGTGIAAGDTIVKIIFDYPPSTEGFGGSAQLLNLSDKASLYKALRDSARYTLLVLAYLFVDIGEGSGFYTTNKGDSREQNFGSQQVLAVTLFPKNNQGGGFQISTDNGVNWMQNNNGLPNLNTSALTGFADNTEASGVVHLYLGMFDNMNGGASIFRIDYTISDVEPVSTLVPDDYELQQNYPNPFNPSTTIKYSVPKASYVTLKVYNLVGEEVATLVNEEQNIGNYNIEFNAAALPSGVYFYRLQADSFVDTKKMILLK